ncbi:iron complex outermembrane receptor protein [Pseudoduganella lurida]|uniref:Iron complex outermembrane receptor protein n=1 Tax=Pseudoduganella lurida TaxID=1036180 RepID=A0A562R0N8_9BURK|nr:TonB-dependent receptor [Pseudoduganella lurida]TWI62629.1 iron complex outermembrane receptor protein [Pseudoduganella lurida]
MHDKTRNRPALRLTLMALACLGAQAHAQSNHETIVDGDKTVVVTAKKVGMGLMVTEDAPKARSTITAEELEKQRATGNAFQALEMLPSVNSYNYDATGLFGGGLSMRGFNSDQIGATINGVPVNDAGTYAVYPQEYVDQENTCSEFVTQGSTDVDSPQIGATGGNFGITSCNPEDVQRHRFTQTLGQLNLTKTFYRYDTGLFADQRSKAFISFSHSEADKWKGKGGAKREHIDSGFSYDWDKFNYIHATLLWNKATNHNVNSVSLAQLNANGYDYDYSTTVPPAVISATAATPATYYGLSLNPFENLIASAIMQFRLNDNTDLKIVPYYWYGFGTGGVQQKYLSETGAFLNGTSTDINGDGIISTNRYLLAGSTLSNTGRPGVTASLTHVIGNHTILGGFWYERSHKGESGPAVQVNADGTPADDYLQAPPVLRADGTQYNSRDWLTVSTSYQAFLQDTVALLDDRLQINAGVRTPYVKRDFTNFPNEGSKSATAYRIKQSYSDVLPQVGVRYRVTNDDQLFASVAKNMKAPPNTILSSANNVQIVNGQPVLSDIKEETSYNLDIGYRHQGSMLISSLTFYQVNFHDRLAAAYNPNNLLSVLTNVGDVKNRGVELEVSNTPINGWAFYGSLGYANSEIKDNLRASSTVVLNTAGNEFPLTPKWKAGLSAEYSNGPGFARLTAKATSKQQATLMNDEEVPGYTTMGFDAGYTFANFMKLKRPRIMINVSNLTDKQYRNPSSQSVTNAKAYGSYAAGTVFYYLGAPRFTSVSFSADF